MAERNGATDGKRFKRVRKADEAKTQPEKKMGAPLKLTPEVQKTICDFIRLVSYIETAARAAGVSRDSFQDWIKRGGKGEQPYANLLREVEKAMAESEMKDLAHLERAAGAGQWQAAAWRLERKMPKKWGRKIEVSGDQNAPLQVNVVKFGDKEIKY